MHKFVNFGLRKINIGVLPGQLGQFWAAGAPGQLSLLIYFALTVLSKRVHSTLVSSRRQAKDRGDNPGNYNKVVLLKQYTPAYF